MGDICLLNQRESQHEIVPIAAALTLTGLRDFSSNFFRGRNMARKTIVGFDASQLELHHESSKVSPIWPALVLLGPCSGCGWSPK